MRRGASIGGGGIILAVIAVFFLGADPAQIIGMLVGGGGQLSAPAPSARQKATEDELADFVSVVVADTEDTWGPIFRSAGYRYQPAKLVLYSGMVHSACGTGSSAAGPFYCPGDHKVYLDLGFLRELKRLGAPGDFAFAYVIAHEIGHHVQNLLGVSQQIRQTQQRVSRREANALSILTELQADCYAGVWAHHAQSQRQILERGDIEEGLGAAAAVGDDRLQQMTGRGIHPESFTHGSSEQRMRWFKSGFQSGDSSACDTFAQARS
jgi:predicted metalloprotease